MGSTDCTTCRIGWSRLVSAPEVRRTSTIYPQGSRALGTYTSGCSESPALKPDVVHQTDDFAIGVLIPPRPYPPPDHVLGAEHPPREERLTILTGGASPSSLERKSRP